MNTKLVEIGARAKVDPGEWDDLPSGIKEVFRSAARRELTAYRDAGYAIAPAEPTGEVLQAGNRVWLDGGNEGQIYKAMIQAGAE